MDKQYYEEARWLKVYDECELLYSLSAAARPDIPRQLLRPGPTVGISS